MNLAQRIKNNVKTHPTPYLAAATAVGVVTGVVITAKYYSVAGFVKDPFTADKWVTELWEKDLRLVAVPASELAKFFGDNIQTAVAGQL